MFCNSISTRQFNRSYLQAITEFTVPEADYLLSTECFQGTGFILSPRNYSLQNLHIENKQETRMIIVKSLIQTHITSKNKQKQIYKITKNRRINDKSRHIHLFKIVRRTNSVDVKNSYSTERFRTHLLFQHLKNCHLNKIQF